MHCFQKIPLFCRKPSLTVVQAGGPQVGLDAVLDSLDDVGTVSAPVGEHTHCGGVRDQTPRPKKNSLCHAMSYVQVDPGRSKNQKCFPNLRKMEISPKNPFSVQNKKK